mmetsp:Transcript_30543/g.101619  ORF Transcript_30543/g.101619 Transcript_30543/m.101619 type:complete len:88 (-) Transcript_30543:8-271(-)
MWEVCIACRRNGQVLACTSGHAELGWMYILMEVLPLSVGTSRFLCTSGHAELRWMYMSAEVLLLSGTTADRSQFSGQMYVRVLSSNC